MRNPVNLLQGLSALDVFDRLIDSADPLDDAREACKILIEGALMRHFTTPCVVRWDENDQVGGIYDTYVSAGDDVEDCLSDIGKGDLQHNGVAATALGADQDQLMERAMEAHLCVELYAAVCGLSSGQVQLTPRLLPTAPIFKMEMP